MFTNCILLVDVRIGMKLSVFCVHLLQFSWYIISKSVAG